MQPANQLVTELNVRGIHFLTGGDTRGVEPNLSPTELLAGLVEQPEARLRLAVIPLLLCRSSFASVVPDVLHQVNEPAQVTLKLYYVAAMLLQQLHAERLRKLLGQWEPLPDLFSEELGLDRGDTLQTQLKVLGEQHQILSGLAVNWEGTYLHAAERLLIRLKREAQWEN